MSRYLYETLYTADIKIKNEIIKPNHMIFYNKNKDVFYDIELLNHLIDIETNQELDNYTKKAVEAEISKKSYLVIDYGYKVIKFKQSLENLSMQ